VPPSHPCLRTQTLVCEEEIVEPKGSCEDLIDVKNSLLEGDSHFGVVRSLLSNPVTSEQ